MRVQRSQRNSRLYRLYRIYRAARTVANVVDKLPGQTVTVKMVITTDEVGELTAVREDQHLIYRIGVEKIKAMMEKHEKVEKAKEVKETSKSGSRAGKAFTPKEKEKVIEANKAKNKGQTTCENFGVATTKPEKSKRGVTPPKTDTHVDHIKPNLWKLGL